MRIDHYSYKVKIHTEGYWVNAMLELNDNRCLIYTPHTSYLDCYISELHSELTEMIFHRLFLQQRKKCLMLRAMDSASVYIFTKPEMVYQSIQKLKSHQSYAENISHTVQRLFKAKTINDHESNEENSDAERDQCPENAVDVQEEGGKATAESNTNCEKKEDTPDPSSSADPENKAEVKPRPDMHSVVLGQFDHWMTQDKLLSSNSRETIIDTIQYIAGQLPEFDLSADCAIQEKAISKALDSTNLSLWSKSFPLSPRPDQITVRVKYAAKKYRQFLLYSLERMSPNLQENPVHSASEAENAKLDIPEKRLQDKGTAQQKPAGTRPEVDKFTNHTETNSLAAILDAFRQWLKGEKKYEDSKVNLYLASVRLLWEHNEPLRKAKSLLIQEKVITDLLADPYCFIWQYLLPNKMRRKNPSFTIKDGAHMYLLYLKTQNHKSSADKKSPDMRPPLKKTFTANTTAEDSMAQYAKSKLYNNLPSPSAGRYLNTVVDSDTIIYVTSGNLKCIRDNHNTYGLYAIVREGRTHGTVNIPIQRCCTCRFYFILKEVLALEEEKYGKLWFNSVEGEPWNSPVTANDWQPESDLYRYGYSVSAKDNLSSGRRQHILESGIKAGYFTQQYAMQQISMFINLNKNKYSMSSAVEKWQEDLAWLVRHKITPEQVHGHLEAYSKRKK